MKIRRFTAPDMRQAINRVRDELGPEAVILSNRKVGGEVEIVAAIDYDEGFLEQEQERSQPSAPKETPAEEPRPAAQPERPAAPRPRPTPFASPAVSFLAELAGRVEARREGPSEPPASEPPAPPPPETEGELAALHEEVRLLKELVEGQMLGLHRGSDGPRTPSVTRIAKRLTELGLAPEWVERLLQRLPRQGPLDRLWAQALRHLAEAIPTRDPAFLRQGGVVVLVGPSGVGKTTTLAKIAAQYILHHQRDGVVLVSCDDHRVGAHEQLRAYGQILGVPVYSTRAREELERVVNRLKDERLILVDTAGSNPLQEGRPPFPGLDGVAAEVLLTVAASVHPQVMAEYIRRYRALGLTGAVLAKCDEALRLGPALCPFMDTGLPLTLVADGPAIPDDLHPAEGRDLVNRSIDKVRRHRPVGTNSAKKTRAEHEGVASDDRA